MCRSYRVRVAALSERACRARSGFLPPEEPPARERALEFLRDGVGPAVALYREASTDMTDTALPPAQSQELDRALNDWLELYAACYGVHLNADASVAEAATILGECHSLEETAARLTGVPDENDTGCAETVAVESPDVSTGADRR